MLELLCHLFGDYSLQNHAMATRKRSSWKYAGLHVAFYMVPFLIVFRPSLVAVVIMAGTHLLIDRFGLARWWTEFWGVGCQGKVSPILGRILGRPAVAAPEPPPPFLAVWLLIIVDNTWHLAINHLALAYLSF